MPETHTHTHTQTHRKSNLLSHCHARYHPISVVNSISADPYWSLQRLSTCPSGHVILLPGKYREWSVLIKQALSLDLMRSGLLNSINTVGIQWSDSHLAEDRSDGLGLT
ncbi:hypothetical protein PoB_006884400 [Plakobranchus ocellatus]|uniref:Uncharacterized protein n=1 Tax=Plakobranchus ocellatus TaxID=259542 RepID=A0AAV4DDQ7_9GAST|nr:hypothetical protein PoB_006884400 [Plakobranchus ocellatus]